MTVYKKFVEKRPEKSRKDNSSFYLSCVPKERIKNEDDPWFYASPIGENYLARLMSMAAEEAGIERRQTTLQEKLL